MDCNAIWVPKIIFRIVNQQLYAKLWFSSRFQCLIGRASRTSSMLGVLNGMNVIFGVARVNGWGSPWFGIEQPRWNGSCKLYIAWFMNSNVYFVGGICQTSQGIEAKRNNLPIDNGRIGKRAQSSRNKITKKSRIASLRWMARQTSHIFDAKIALSVDKKKKWNTRAGICLLTIENRSPLFLSCAGELKSPVIWHFLNK